MKGERPADRTVELDPVRDLLYHGEPPVGVERIAS
jgi:hypothetical protein